MLKLNEVRLTEITRSDYEEIADSWGFYRDAIPGFGYARIENQLILFDAEELLHSVHSCNYATIVEVPSNGKKHKYKPKELKGKYLGRALGECQSSNDDITVHFNDSIKHNSMKICFRYYQGRLTGYRIKMKGDESSIIQIPDMNCSGIEALLYKE